MAEFRRNGKIPCMLLESFGCRSRSNRPCAAKVQNNVSWMVGKIQWSCHRPCSMSLCAEPPSICSPGVVSPMTGRPIVWFPGLAISFFVGCFWGWQSGLRKGSFLAFSFWSFPLLLFWWKSLLALVSGCKGEITLLKTIIAFWQAFLAFLSFGPPFGILPLLITKECSSCPFGTTIVFSFSLSFSPFHRVALEWSGLPGTLSVVPCPETWSLIINVALLASHFIPGSLSKVVFSVVFHDECSVHAAFRRTEQTVPQSLFLPIQQCKWRHSFSKEKWNLWVLSLSDHSQQWTWMLSRYHWMDKSLSVVALLCSIPSVSSRLWVLL